MRSRKSIDKRNLKWYQRSIWILMCFSFCFLLGGCEKRGAMVTLSAQDTSSMAQLLPVVPSDGEDMQGTLSLHANGSVLTPVSTPSSASLLTLSTTLTITPTTTPTPTPTPTPTVKEVTLVAVGDDLLHKKAIDSGIQKDGSYNYDHLFKHLKKDFMSADLAVINQETILGTKKMGYSGFPRFCSPTAVGDAIRKAGFDVVLHATNHVADKGVGGIENTLNYWSKYPEITVVGIHESQKSYANISVVERNGIKIALLNYTYGTNGLTLPRDKYYLVNDFNEKNMANDIKKAKEMADFIVVFPHWGTEYQYKENKYQKLWADFFAEQGVDLVIGAHPHVLQPIEWVTSSTGHKMLVYYSLGNYVSTMDYTDRMLGGMANITIVQEKGSTRIKDASLTPIVTHYERGGDYNLTVYKLADYTQKLASKHYILGNYRGKDFSLDKLNKLSEQIVGEWITKE